MNISLQQNSPDNIRLLAAQRHLYTKAKNLRRWRIFGSISLAVIAPFFLFFYPNSKSIVAGIGGTWLIIANLVLQGIEAKKIKQAANIQEQFDTNLFDLSWNHTLIGSKLTPEIIFSADREFKGDRKTLENWYPDCGSTPYPLNVLLCQRANIVWDWRLRRYYAAIIITITSVFFGFTVIFAIITKQTFVGYLLGLFFPSSSAFLQGIEVSKAHLTTAKEKENTEKEVSALWDTGLNNPTSVSKEQCRRIQDCIYLSRSKGPLVPDWWYRKLRDKFEIDMHSVVSDLKTKAKQRFLHS